MSPGSVKKFCNFIPYFYVAWFSWKEPLLLQVIGYMWQTSKEVIRKFKMLPEAHLGPGHTSKMEHFTKVVNSWKQKDHILFGRPSALYMRTQNLVLNLSTFFIPSGNKAFLKNRSRRYSKVCEETEGKAYNNYLWTSLSRRDEVLLVQSLNVIIIIILLSIWHFRKTIFTKAALQRCSCKKVKQLYSNRTLT